MAYKPNYEYIPPIKWSILTPFYDFFCTIIGLGSGFKQKVLMSVNLKDGFVVADIGCGTGVFLKIGKTKYPKVNFIGIDPDKKALAIAEKRFAKLKIKVELKDAFSESLPLPDKLIDVCFSTLTFHHMPNEVKLKAIQEMYRVLKPNGIVVIADFGEGKNIFFRIMHIFEKLEYLEGNLKGLIFKYLKKVGFTGSEIIGTHFPAIKIIKAQKNYDF